MPDIVSQQQDFDLVKYMLIFSANFLGQLKPESKIIRLTDGKKTQCLLLTFWLRVFYSQTMIDFPLAKQSMLNSTIPKHANLILCQKHQWVCLEITSVLESQVRSLP